MVEEDSYKMALEGGGVAQDTHSSNCGAPLRDLPHITATIAWYARIEPSFAFTQSLVS